MSRHSVLQPSRQHPASILVRTPILAIKPSMAHIFSPNFLSAFFSLLRHVQLDMGSKAGSKTDVPVEIHVRVRFLLSFLEFAVLSLSNTGSIHA